MKHKGTTLCVEYGKYRNGQNSILLNYAKDSLPYAVASVAIEHSLKPDEVAIKNYSENEGILDVLLSERIVSEPHRFISSGFVQIPICKIKKI